MAESVGAVVMPHVPQVGAGRLGHADSVAGVAAEGGAQHGRGLPVLSLHGRIAFESAAGEDHGAAGTHGLSAIGPESDNRPAAFHEQPLRRRAETHFDAAARQVHLHDPEQASPLGRALDVGPSLGRIEAGERVHIDEAEGLVAGKGIVGRRCATPQLGRDALRQRIEPCRKADHALRKTAQYVVRASCPHWSPSDRRAPRRHPPRPAVRRRSRSRFRRDRTSSPQRGPRRPRRARRWPPWLRRIHSRPRRHRR